MGKLPKKLGLKMGTAEEAEWTRISKVQEETLRNCKINMLIAEKVLRLAKENILLEQAKFREKRKV